MSLACPKCGSRYLKDSKPRTSSERLSRFWFVAPLRCLDCHTRFVMQTVIWEDIFFARCPKCLRMDLARWTGKTFDPPFWMKMKCNFGAKKWRCEYCRMNFASWRKRKEIFSFKRWKKLNAGEARAEARARVTELQLKTEQRIEARQASGEVQVAADEEDDELT